MTVYTYEPGLALEDVTLYPSVGAIGEFTNAAGTILPILDLNGFVTPLVTNSKGYFPGFKVDGASSGTLRFGGLGLPVVSIEARDSGLQAFASAASAQAAAASASASQLAAVAAKSAAESAALAATAPTDGAIATVIGTQGSATRVALDAAYGGPNGVSKVAGKTGDVTLVKADVGLGSVDNTSDANKPVSAAVATELAKLAPKANAVFTGTVTVPDGALSIADTAGLQTALNAKATATPYDAKIVVRPVGDTSIPANPIAGMLLLNRTT